MASIINASTSGAGGVITTADASGVLQLQSGGVTAMQIDASRNVTFTNPVSGNSFTLVGTITTASGTSATLSGLTLTSYRQLYLVLNSVGMIAGSGNGHQIQIGSAFGSTFASLVQQTYNGAITIDLSSGYGTTITTNPNTSSNLSNTIIKSGITTASTSITVTSNLGVPTFNAGSISVYGVR